MLLKDAYLALLQGLLPTGPAWTREPDAVMTDFLSVAAGGFADVHERAMQILEEADPRTTIEMLAEWEADHGLPDSCTGGNGSIQERQATLVQKIISTGGQSRPYFTALAAALGYDIEITEFKPFVCGYSFCGVGILHDTHGYTETGITDDAALRFNWRVKVLGPRVTFFRCGLSECGRDPMAKISRADDLECILYRLKPAHTNLIFAYEEIEPDDEVTYLGDVVTFGGDAVTV